MAFPIVFRERRSLPSQGANPFWSSVERLFEDLQRGDVAAGSDFVPRLEVVEREGEFVVTAELPGLEEKDFQVEVHGNVLTLRGEKRSEQTGEHDGRHFTERVYGEFRRGLELPVEVQSEKTSASFKNGVLAVTLPKAETAKVRNIPVTSA
ncbi:MAG: putative HspC2 heat shock protein [Deltaproteobacteria bacterium]|nr:putative HspC2 heat shock protein [Deltaproteobacteria bacterium]